MHTRGREDSKSPPNACERERESKDGLGPGRRLEGGGGLAREIACFRRVEETEGEERKAERETKRETEREWSFGLCRAWQGP